MAPVTTIPGGYGPPLLGAIRDRWDFFYLQGEVDFFRSRVKKYGSTVFRVNLVPSSTSLGDSRGIALLDQKCFPVLFDSEKVDKANVFTGPYVPASDFTGGFRPLAYLDTTEKHHRLLKQFVFEVIKSKCRYFLPQLQASFHEWMDKFAELESGKGDLVPYLEPMAFAFMAGSFVYGGRENRVSKMDAKEGAGTLKTWIGIQFAPIVPAGSTGLPSLLEDLLMHTVRLPFFLVAGSYTKICDFLGQATDILEIGQKDFGLHRDEVLHNFAFVFGVNSWLAFSKLFPALVFKLASAGTAFQRQLGKEVRDAFPDPAAASSQFMKAVDSMPLLDSTMLEFFRMEPPAPYQYAHARKDFVVESHTGAYQIRKGDLLGGSQALVCRDPMVFDDPETFQPDRFLGPEKQKLAKYVFWSNGPHTHASSSSNKQCAAKDFSWMVAKFFVVQLFLKYERLELAEGATPTKLVVKSLKQV